MENAISDLIQAAQDARENAYAPYSNYRVGAAVEAEDGSIIPGCNVENAVLGVTICAERTALCAAISQGHKSFKRLVVATGNGGAPCGVCRQTIWELCKDIPIHVIDSEGKQKNFTSKGLLPDSWDAQDLVDGRDG